MTYKKYFILFVVLIGLILSLSFLFKSIPIQKIRLSITGLFTQIRTESDITTAINKLTGGEEHILLKIAEEDKCYWVTSSMRRKNYVLEIREYHSTTEPCLGFPLGESEISLDHGINIIGDTDCLCGGREYLLEWGEIGLRITKW